MMRRSVVCLEASLGKDFRSGMLDRLERGEQRSAHKDADGKWTVDQRCKMEVLALHRDRPLIQMGKFVDKEGFEPQKFTPERRVRIVPGGSSVRRGAYIAPGVVILPPSFVNVGAYIDEYSLIDSNALVGSFAQVGKRVHVSAGAVLGGVLEPSRESPVVVEDDAFVGGQAGLYEGIVVGKGAVVGAGVTLTACMDIIDVVNQKIYRQRVPDGAVVVPGTKPLKGSFAESMGLSVATAIIIKYRDHKTDAKTALEEALREIWK